MRERESERLDKVFRWAKSREQVSVTDDMKRRKEVWSENLARFKRNRECRERMKREVGHLLGTW